MKSALFIFSILLIFLFSLYSYGQEYRPTAQTKKIHEEQIQHCTISNNPFINEMKDGDFVNVFGEMGRLVFGTAGLFAGLPLVGLADIFYYPFSGEEDLYECGKNMYYAYSDFMKNHFRYYGYYLALFRFTVSDY